VTVPTYITALTTLELACALLAHGLSRTWDLAYWDADLFRSVSIRVLWLAIQRRAGK